MICLRLFLLFLLFFYYSSPSISALSHCEPIRINKVLRKTHSRRQADQLIATGRLTVNNEPVHSAGQKVIPYHDVIRLDDHVVRGWEELNHQKSFNDNSSSVLEYVKYWKPLGVTCTTDTRVPNNLMDALSSQQCHTHSRIFPVGRLDKNTSGLLLLTSDGRLVNASLRGKYRHGKTYLVRPDRPVGKMDLQRLREGVVITTVAQRDGNRGKPLTASTLPCEVRELSQPSSSRDPYLLSHNQILEITLFEGRNRQIRKMMEALGYRVLELHRKSFMGMTLEGLGGPGDWSFLGENEMEIVNSVLNQANVGVGE